MKVSNRVKRNISLALTALGCVILVARIIDPILSRSIDGKGWMDIIGAVVLTCCACDNYIMYRRRVRTGD